MREYTVRKRGSKYQVVGHTGNVKGEHDTEQEAKDQVKAIYANMNEATVFNTPLKHDVTFYVVTYLPDVDSPLQDFLFETTIRDIMLQAKGGLRTDEIAGVFLDKEEARSFAKKLERAKTGNPLNETIGEPLGSEDTRETKENALKQILGNEELNVQDLTDEALDIIMQRLTGVGDIQESVQTIVSVMRDLKASDNDVIEALAVNLKMHLHEAEEVYKEYTLKG